MEMSTILGLLVLSEGRDSPALKSLENMEGQQELKQIREPPSYASHLLCVLILHLPCPSASGYFPAQPQAPGPDRSLRKLVSPSAWKSIREAPPGWLGHRLVGMLPLRQRSMCSVVSSN